MGNAYFESIRNALSGLLQLLIKVALPLVILIGTALIARALAKREAEGDRRIQLSNFAGYSAIVLVLLCSWAALKTARDVERRNIDWERSAEDTANPTPDAPPVYQYNPSVGALVEKTYTRTLTLPPDFLERIGADGVGIIAPYLSDPSAENVIRLSDTFRRSGRDAVFTREVVRMDEEPIGFDSSTVSVGFRRLGDAAFDLDFVGTFIFKNEGAETSKIRFTFPLSTGGGTVRDMVLKVGTEEIREPNDEGNYEWVGNVSPGENRTAIVQFKTIGTRDWTYDIGSTRRRVKQFKLTATTDGEVRFPRGTLVPTTQNGNQVTWDIPNALTAQRLSLAFPPDRFAEDGYLQALGSLPFALVALGLGLFILRAVSFPELTSVQVAAATILFALGLGSSVVLKGYMHPGIAVSLGCAIGAGLVVFLLSKRAILALIPATAIPLAFLSGNHTGLILLLVGLATVALFIRELRVPKPEPAT